MERNIFSDPGYWTVNKLRGKKESGLTGRTNDYGVDYGDKNYAGNTYAALTRQQWADYTSTFVPIENKLIDYATNPNVVGDAMSGASQNVSDAFTAQEGSTQRRLQGLGLQLNSDEEAAQKRSFGLAKSLADVQAQNYAGDATRQRQTSVLGNPAPSVPTGGD
jgi:hypothetical protein